MLAVLNDMSDQVEVLIFLVAGVGGKCCQVRRFESLARRARGDARRTAAQSIGDDAVEEGNPYQISSRNVQVDGGKQPDRQQAGESLLAVGRNALIAFIDLA